MTNKNLEKKITAGSTLLISCALVIALIANYFHTRANSGFVEGLNNKLKLITRRSYGLKRVDSLFRRLWLDLNGYKHFLS